MNSKTSRLACCAWQTDDTALHWSEDIGAWKNESEDTWVALWCTTKWIARQKKVLQDVVSHIEHPLL